MSATATKTKASKVETPVFVPCGRCGGQGGFACYGHIYNGVCFECDGARGHWSTVEHEARLAKRREQARARRAAKRAAEAAQRAEVGQAFLSQHEGLAQALETDHSISADLKEKVLHFGSLSEAQIALAMKIAAEAAEAATVVQVEVVEGRGSVTGSVTSVKWEEDGFSYHGGMVCKIVVLDDRGFRLYGTAPKAIRESVEKGSKISFTATLVAKEEGFGFFQRATAATIL